MKYIFLLMLSLLQTTVYLQACYRRAIFIINEGNCSVVFETDLLKVKICELELQFFSSEKELKGKFDLDYQGWNLIEMCSKTNMLEVSLNNILGLSELSFKMETEFKFLQNDSSDNFIIKTFKKELLSELNSLYSHTSLGKPVFRFKYQDSIPAFIEKKITPTNWINEENFKPYKGFSELKRTVAFCFDYKYNYIEDAHTQFESTDSLSDYRFMHGMISDILIYFGHHTVTIPPVSYVKIGHQVGSKVFASIVLEGGNRGDLKYFIEESRTEKKPFMDKLVETATAYGFDGYLLNFEVSVDELDKLLLWIKIFRDKLHTVSKEIIWYDSLNYNSTVIYAGQINSSNRLFFLIADYFFLDYRWAVENISTSIAETGQEPKRLLYGIDVFERTSVQGMTKVSKLSTILKTHKCSMAVFAPGYIVENNDGESSFEVQQHNDWITFGNGEADINKCLQPIELENGNFKIEILKEVFINKSPFSDVKLTAKLSGLKKGDFCTLQIEFFNKDKKSLNKIDFGQEIEKDGNLDFVKLISLDLMAEFLYELEYISATLKTTNSGEGKVNSICFTSYKSGQESFSATVEPKKVTKLPFTSFMRLGFTKSKLPGKKNRNLLDFDWAVSQSSTWDVRVGRWIEIRLHSNNPVEVPLLHFELNSEPMTCEVSLSRSNLGKNIKIDVQLIGSNQLSKASSVSEVESTIEVFTVTKSNAKTEKLVLVASNNDDETSSNKIIIDTPKPNTCENRETYIKLRINRISCFSSRPNIDSENLLTIEYSLTTSIFDQSKFDIGFKVEANNQISEQIKFIWIYHKEKPIDSMYFKTLTIRNLDLFEGNDVEELKFVIGLSDGRRIIKLKTIEKQKLYDIWKHIS